jgi:hypothetical protein
LKRYYTIFLFFFINFGFFSSEEFVILYINPDESRRNIIKDFSIKSDFKSWKHFTPIEIEELSGNDLVDFPIKLSLNLQKLIQQNKLESDIRDLRFAASTGQTIDYWIETAINSNITNIWIKIPLLKSKTKIIINMYYGNPAVGSISDGRKVFDYYDSFEDNDLGNYLVNVVGSVPYTISDHDSYNGDFTLTIGPSSCVAYCWDDYRVSFRVENIDLSSDLYEISYWRREPQNNGGETTFNINNFEKYRKNGPPTSEDTGWERNEIVFNGIIRNFELIESDVTTDQRITIDEIIIRKVMILGPSYSILTEISNLDTDSDGIPDWYEINNGLNITENDSSEDSDNDGISNYDEFIAGLDASTDDANSDLDGDGMPNLYELKMGLNVSFNDADLDKDGDWVSNFLEFRENTNPSDFLSFPLFYHEFPFVCLSLLHLLSFGFLTTITFSGILTFIIYDRRKLIQQLGAPDYKTAQLMLKGEFEDFETFSKAQEMSIASLKEYQFTLEMANLEKEENG